MYSPCGFIQIAAVILSPRSALVLEPTCKGEVNISTLNSK